ncbi:MAG TPA: hypothetical protein VNG33_22540 [Polyangiaceae bacterium]|nr:hypothetical protein [Polyangiaceae bacterium]
MNGSVFHRWMPCLALALGTLPLIALITLAVPAPREQAKLTGLPATRGAERPRAEPKTALPLATRQTEPTVLAEPVVAKASPAATQAPAPELDSQALPDAAPFIASASEWHERLARPFRVLSDTPTEADSEARLAVAIRPTTQRDAVEVSRKVQALLER